MLSGKSILIVEDSALIAVDIEDLVKELGAIHIANLDSLKGGGIGVRRVDLAIIDIHTADDVHENLDVVLGQHGPPIVYLSTDPDAARAPGSLNRFKIVQKPFTTAELSAAISSVLR